MYNLVGFCEIFFYCKMGVSRMNTHYVVKLQLDLIITLLEITKPVATFFPKKMCIMFGEHSS